VWEGGVRASLPPFFEVAEKGRGVFLSDAHDGAKSCLRDGLELCSS